MLMNIYFHTFRDMDERYKHMCDTAKTRSIVAMGISCFQYMPLNNSAGSPASGNNFNFLAQTFNLLLLSTEEYTVDPVSLKFLVDHGFDFNMQYSCGLPYTSSSDSVSLCCIKLYDSICFPFIVVFM